MSSPVCIACQQPLLTPVTLRSPDRLYGLSPDVYDIAVCERCGTGTTLPTLPDAELARFYPSRYSAHQAPRNSLLSRALDVFMQVRHRRTLARHPYNLMGPPARALDVGCGRGDLGSALVRQGWQVDGVEPSADACVIARSRGVQAHAGTLPTVELEHDCYSTVIFSHSLEHLADPGDAIRRSVELLRPGGLLVISVPDFGNWQRRLFGGAWFGLDVPRHRAHFTVGALSAMVSESGLEVVESTTTTAAVVLPGSIQYMLFGRCLFRDGLGFYLANAVAMAVSPISALADRLLGGGAYLHLVARRPPAPVQR